MTRARLGPPMQTPKPASPLTTSDLRHCAEARLLKRRKNPSSKAAVPKLEPDILRLLHELQVHQVELEMQNGELQEVRNRLETLLEKYTDLYDFAPVGYFSLDDQGRILEVNLTGAAMLGLERSRLLNRCLPHFVVSANQPHFRRFLTQVFAGTGKAFCEASLLRADAAEFWASLHGTSAISLSGPPKWCRVTISDITSLKQAEQAQARMEALALANRELRGQIVRRQAAEETLKQSEQNQRQLLEQSRQMQGELRHLSRQVLRAQEEERKRISRELHDVIAQTLTGINVRLAALKRDAALGSKGLDRQVTRTQRLVERSVNIVHRFARELRPAVLDDLGLIPALHTFLKGFKEQTGIHVSLSAFAAVEQVTGDKRTILYRVAQEALTNVARHAHASRAEVLIQQVDGTVCMSIKDNGQGFAEGSVLHAKKRKRLGLLGMRERLDMVRGRFTVTSAPGKGTTVLAQIPLMTRAGGGEAKATLISLTRTKD
jgi:PAS domain S-box-containing protein